MAYDTFRLQGFHLLRLAIQAIHSSDAASAFARRYSRSRCCFPFLWVLRCFSSPRSLRTPMHSVHDDQDWPGFPIRTSRDHSLVTGSLGLFAGSYVLHRLSTPRHPPCALGSLDHANPMPRTPRTQHAEPTRQRANSSANTTTLRRSLFCLLLPGPGFGIPDRLLLPLPGCQRAGSPSRFTRSGLPRRPPDGTSWRGGGILAPHPRSSRPNHPLSAVRPNFSVN